MDTLPEFDGLLAMDEELVFPLDLDFSMEVIDPESNSNSTTFSATETNECDPLNPILETLPNIDLFDIASTSSPSVPSPMTSEASLSPTPVTSTTFGEVEDDGTDTSNNGDGKLLCQVCGNVAGKHSYYGGQVCNSCRAFFRRCVVSRATAAFKRKCKWRARRRRRKQQGRQMQDQLQVEEELSEVQVRAVPEGRDEAAVDPAATGVRDSVRDRGRGQALQAWLQGKETGSAGVRYRLLGLGKRPRLGEGVGRALHER